MNYLHYILALVALLALVPTVTYLLPGHPAHFLPALTAGLALLVWFLPTSLDAGLSLVVPATVLIKLLSIDPVPTESLSYKPVTSRLARLTGKFKSVAATARLPRVVWRSQPEAEQPGTDLTPLTKAYPRPSNWETGNLVPDAPEPEDEEAPPELEPPAQQTQIRKFVPSLLD